MLAGVGMMVCCSSSVAALMMGGKEETPDPVIGAGPSAADDADFDDLDEDAAADDDAPDCSAAQTDWIRLKSKGISQSQGESLKKCKVPANLQSRTYCDVAKTDWINGQIENSDSRMTFEQASSLRIVSFPTTKPYHQRVV